MRRAPRTLHIDLVQRVDAGPDTLRLAADIVLLVDDQFINRTILERQLVPCGISVVLCRSGAEALAALAEGVFDAILTDPNLAPDIQLLLSRLQSSLLRVALRDPTALDQASHAQNSTVFTPSITGPSPKSYCNHNPGSVTHGRCTRTCPSR